MDKAELARGRNWQKARLVGSVVNTSYLTHTEKEILEQISHLKRILLRNWDFNTKALGLNVVRYNVYVEGKLWKESVPYYMARFYSQNNEESITYKKCKDE